MATAEQLTTTERYGGSVDVFGNLGGTLHEALREVAGTGRPRLFASGGGPTRCH